MRLINVDTLALEEFIGDNIPRYAILSHTWGPDEVCYQDWKNMAVARERTGFQKIELARRHAISQDIGYLWIDTNCINKDSSAELAEAINSMFAWYRDAEICYAYLSDVSEAEDCDEAASKDALLSRVSQIGTRKSLVETISKVTGISTAYLVYKRKRIAPISGASVAERMSWLSCRKTSRVEDMAYCMLGIFDINMPLLYGEGSRAFTRLQGEILRISTDESLFCWSWNEDDPPSWTSMLAPSPRNFRNAREYHPARDESSRPVPYSMTNFGLSIQLPIIRLAELPRSDVWLRPFEYIAVFSAGTTDGHLVGIPLEKTPTLDTYKVVRDCPWPIALCWKNRLSLKTDGVKATHLDIFVPSRGFDSSGQESRLTYPDTKNSLGD
ncbi:unnamed protein product [Colletotrichum noveboracense]|uniref:Heterokaryon incompatibility domain-containing protein n=1 Tax=Colletotrichum noveboracense TaxID=2664923 RepID=A0A9W4S2C1_9PEZI|nr:unnamed protein product [Colletotrichum noveboracense]